MKSYVSAMFAAVIMSAHPARSEVAIIAFESGRLTWTTDVTNGTATIEWASELPASWNRDWSSLTDVPVTSNYMTVEVPMFFRIVERRPQPSSNTLVTVEYDSDDLVIYQSNSNTYPNGYGTYQKNGPEYTFYLARYETSNAEFCQFLNDAEQNQANARGAHMHFADNGTVYMDATEQFDELLFACSSSKLRYDAEAPEGFRYYVETNNPAAGGTYDNHPVYGVSWFGALKYCNWLTIDNGLGLSARCYTEGGQPPDWGPVTAPLWDMGIFTDGEREEWLTYAGYRLPMDGGRAKAGPFNEYYKAAAWRSGTNALYGFGRDIFGPRDANYFGSDDPFEVNTATASTPVGYFDGTDHGGQFLTRPNENGYGIFDLSGNVAEWLTDCSSGTSGRALRGGSFGGGCWKAEDRFVGLPYEGFDSSDFYGFRTLTTGGQP